MLIHFFAGPIDIQIPWWGVILFYLFFGAMICALFFIFTLAIILLVKLYYSLFADQSYYNNGKYFEILYRSFLLRSAILFSLLGGIVYFIDSTVEKGIKTYEQEIETSLYLFIAYVIMVIITFTIDLTLSVLDAKKKYRNLQTLNLDSIGNSYNTNSMQDVNNNFKL